MRIATSSRAATVPGVRRLLLAAAAALVLLAVLTVPVLILASDDEVRPADAIVALAGDEQRLPVAADLARRGVATLVLVSEDEGDPARVEACARGGEGFSVECFRADPYSTRGEMRQARLVAETRGWERIVVVTSRFHVRRTRMLFERCLDADVVVVAAPNPTWRLPLTLPVEWGKLVRDALVLRGC